VSLHSNCSLNFCFNCFRQVLAMDGRRSVSIAGNLSSACLEKFSVCGSFEISSFSTYYIRDNGAVQSNRRNITFLVVYGQKEESYQAETQGQNVYLVRFPAKVLGISMMAIYCDGIQIPNSPFRFEVALRRCAEFPGRVPDLVGNCVCPAEKPVEIRGACISFAQLLPSVILPVLACLAILAAVHARKQSSEEQKLWLIKSKLLIWPETPEILGQGSGGTVYRADYRGTPVAIKRFDFSGGEAKDAVIQQPGDSGSETAVNDRNIMNRSLSSVSQESNVSRASYFLGRQYSKNLFGRNKSLHNSQIQSPISLRKDVKATVKFLVGVRHPCITTVMGGVVLQGKELCLVLELMELGSLWDCLHNVLFPIDGDMALNILRTVSSGMTFLHAADPPILHGDLKSGIALLSLSFLSQNGVIVGSDHAGNILIDKNFVAKITDFCPNLSGQRGTMQWTAPERLLAAPMPPNTWTAGKNKSSRTSTLLPSDVYSYGVVMYECLTRKEPFQGLAPFEVLQGVRSNTLRLPAPPGCNAVMINLLAECLSFEARLRPTFSEIERRLNVMDALQVISDALTAPETSIPSTLGWRRAAGRTMGDSLPTSRRNSDLPMARTKFLDPASSGLGQAVQSDFTPRSILLDLFPAHVAEALMRGEKVPPERKEMVTMFFSGMYFFSIEFVDLKFEYESEY
jgi:serine/threonine protein kinase